MNIKLQGPNGEIYEAKPKDSNNYVVRIQGEEYSILLTGTNSDNFSNLSNVQKKN
ncbi:hypothetical protein [Radiobacillus sp. PE A8.2]|uniref:hypothetical protein n=1 Tax=Radiobacillus sp. PE A8.2 TaxID=3380349 RepID=UPI00388FCDCD